MGGPKRLRPRVGLTCNGCNGFGGKTSDERGEEAFPWYPVTPSPSPALLYLTATCGV